MELGPRDLASGNIVLKRRDTGAKEVVPQAEIAARLPAALEADAEGPLQRGQTAHARQHCGGKLDRRSGIDFERGDGRKRRREIRDGAFEGRSRMRRARLKEFKATVRNIPLKDEFDGAGKCIVTGEAVDRRVAIAKAY
jgi:prolyl-tRNA synthetase